MRIRALPTRARGLPWLVLGGVGLLVAASTVGAFQLHRTALSGGAVDVAGGSYALRGTVGEAGGVVNAVGGGSYLMSQGFWFPPGGSIIEVDDALTLPAISALDLAAPNPFASGTVVSYAVAKAERVRLEFFDVSGRRVRLLLDDVIPAGYHHVRWDGRDDTGRPLASGVYYAAMQIGAWRETRKVLKLR